MMHIAKRRRGSTLSEVIVAAVLLLAGIGILVRGTVGAKQLWQDTQHYQLALDELSNQLERIVALEPNKRHVAIDSLEPSAMLKHLIPSARLAIETHNDEDGQRLVISVHSEGDGRLPKISLVGWLPAETPPDTQNATASSAGDQR